MTQVISQILKNAEKPRLESKVKYSRLKANTNRLNLAVTIISRCWPEDNHNRADISAFRWCEMKR